VSPVVVEVEGITTVLQLAAVSLVVVVVLVQYFMQLTTLSLLEPPIRLLLVLEEQLELLVAVLAVVAYKDPMVEQLFSAILYVFYV
jgi:hypothetical protein